LFGAAEDCDWVVGFEDVERGIAGHEERLDFMVRGEEGVVDRWEMSVIGQGEGEGEVRSQ
jgi:hypothetical protein